MVTGRRKVPSLCKNHKNVMNLVGGGLDEPASGYHVRSATLQLAFENVQAFTNAPTKRGAITDVDNANHVST